MVINKQGRSQFTCGLKPEKFRASTGFEPPWPPWNRCDALPTELWSCSTTTAVQIWIIPYIRHFISLRGEIWTHLIDLALSVWLYSSVGRASHRYRGGHGFESRWSPEFFRLLSNCFNWKIYCDDHSWLSSTTAVQIWINGLASLTSRATWMWRIFGSTD